MHLPNRPFSLHHIPRYSTLLFRALRSPMLVYFVLAGNALTAGAAVVFTQVEGGINPQVRGYFDGLWWAMTTVTTVGYGDITPVTTAGRLIAMALMVSGISFFVGFAAVLVSTVDALARDDAAEDSAESVIGELHAEMRTLRAELAELRRELRHEPRDGVGDTA